MNLSEGSAYIQFALAKLISLSTVVMEYLCLQMGEAHYSSLLVSAGKFVRRTA
jgi:hypothetical protein